MKTPVKSKNESKMKTKEELINELTEVIHTLRKIWGTVLSDCDAYSMIDHPSLFTIVHRSVIVNLR